MYRKQRYARRLKTGFTLGLLLCLSATYLLWVDSLPEFTLDFGPFHYVIPIPNLQPQVARYSVPVGGEQTELQMYVADAVEVLRVETLNARRAERIAKVKAFFQRYGARLQGYEAIFVDKAEECGGDYRILVGIAGSESGLGRIMYKKYNPFGYLNGVEYASQEEALNFLACQISQQHIARCGDDLYCLGRRYAGPGDDLELFVSKVRWFAQQVS